MKRNALWLVILLAGFLMITCGGPKKQEQTAQPADSALTTAADAQPEYAQTADGNPIVILNTSKGDIEIEVFEKNSPNHGGNFIKLVKSGFYDGLTFHRIIPDTLAETGDPTGTGAGSAGYSLEPERTPYTNKAGYLGMVPTAEGKSNGSQFYILVVDNSQMDAQTACFGKVLSGMEVVVTISKTPVQKGKPIETIKIAEAYLKPLVSATEINQSDTTITTTTK